MLLQSQQQFCTGKMLGYGSGNEVFSKTDHLQTIQNEERELEKSAILLWLMMMMMVMVKVVVVV